jgi:hypothetical protein
MKFNMRQFGYSCVVALLFGVGLFKPEQVAHAQVTSDQDPTAQVWEHHIQAWQDRNVDAIVADYSNDSIVIVNNRIYTGKNEIKKLFQGLFAIFDHGVNRIDPPTVKENLVYITWHFTPDHESKTFGTDTFLIKNGIIEFQTIGSALYETHPEAALSQ